MRSDAMSVARIAGRLASPGIGTRQQWLEAGAPRRMFEDGRLRRIARGLYVGADDSDVALDRLAALLPEGAVIGGWAAAQAFGFRDAGPTMTATTEQPILAYLARNDHRQPAGFVVRRSDLQDGESLVRDGVALTSPARTAYDLARFSAGIRSAVGLVDSARWPGAGEPVTPECLLQMVAAHPHGKGNPLVRGAIELSTGRARSFAESSLRARWVREVGVPPDRILVNATVTVDGRTFELDLIDVSAGLAIEYDGKPHSDADQRSRDARKDAVLDDLGVSRARCNAPELRSSTAVFAAWAAQRRHVAIRQGSRERVARLLRNGRLAERPLKLY